ncbi:MAG: diguanylate cyclase [Leptothrix sp. (in: b-proteobacteria)]
MPTKTITLISKRQVIARIVTIITLVEFLIMLGLQYIPHDAGVCVDALIDISLLSLCSAPLIYLWVVRPFVDARDDALERWSRLAFTDPLTQLGNRRLLLTHLQKAISSGLRHKMRGALLLIDLDGFKPVNDKYGHEAGDAVLIEVAKRLQTFTRSEDVAVRLGGDEFVLLIDHVDADPQIVRDKVQRIADKLIALVSQPVLFQERSFSVSASIGVRVFGSEGLDPDLAIAQADQALYRAKNAGRSCTEFFQ